MSKTRHTRNTAAPTLYPCPNTVVDGDTDDELLDPDIQCNGGDCDTCPDLELCDDETDDDEEDEDDEADEDDEDDDLTD